MPVIIAHSAPGRQRPTFFPLGQALWPALRLPAKTFSEKTLTADFFYLIVKIPGKATGLFDWVIYLFCRSNIPIFHGMKNYEGSFF
jgi:hypothetical protein